MENCTRVTYSPSLYHENLSPLQKQKILHDFRIGQTRLFITPNAVDLSMSTSISIVYDFPSDSNEYIQWVGRKGRYGLSSVEAMSLVERERVREMEEVKGRLGIEMEECFIVCS